MRLNERKPDDNWRHMGRYLFAFSCARELFEAAAEASRDAERIRNQLEEAEQRTLSSDSSTVGYRVSGSRDPDGRMVSAVSSKMELEDALRERQERDYALIDLACHVLYGTDSTAGLWALVGWRADALAQRYLNGLTWAQVGDLMGYSESHVWQQAQVALEVCDANGVMWTIMGRGGAEG